MAAQETPETVKDFSLVPASQDALRRGARRGPRDPDIERRARVKPGRLPCTRDVGARGRALLRWRPPGDFWV